MKTTAVSLTLLLLASAAGAQVATVPYTEDFNAGGPLGPEWTLANSAAQGRIRFTVSGSVSPLSGGNSMVMDKDPGGGSDVTNTATLAVDFSGSGGGILSFYFKETSDENDSGDGVFISDGGPQLLLVDLQNGPSSWTEFTVDVGDFIANNGLNVNNVIQIVFSHQDNFPVPTDGFFFDDVRLTPPPPGLDVDVTSSGGDLNWTVTSLNPAAPNAEVYNFASVMDFTPDGSGPFFGIGFDAIPQVSTPKSPGNPFHTCLDAAGTFSLVLPPASLPPGLHFETVSVLIEAGALTRISNVASVDT